MLSVSALFVGHVAILAENLRLWAGLRHLPVSVLCCFWAFGSSGGGLFFGTFGMCVCVCVRVFVDHVPMYLCFDLVISDKTICRCSFAYVPLFMYSWTD